MSVKSISKNLPTINIVTTHGKICILPLNEAESIFSILYRTHIPWSAVSVFGFDSYQNNLTISSLDKAISEVREDIQEIQIHFNRNINPTLFSVLKHNIANANDGPPVSSFIYQSIDPIDNTVTHTLKALSQSECQSIICKNVHDFIDNYLKANDTLIVGVSGGGDSNSILLGLTSYTKFKLNIHPVILKGIPDWDAGVPRAQSLCQLYGLQLSIVEEDEVCTLCDLKGSGDIISLYESIFPGDDFEFLGTYMIRKVLTAYANKKNAKVITGLNLEDILAESLLRISSQKKPLPFPLRIIQNTHFLYPLWLCPKKIIDGCFPKLSIENYEMRYPCFSPGRNLYYMLAYSIQSFYPHLTEKLIQGFRQLSDDNNNPFIEDADFGVILDSPIPITIRESLKKLMR